MGKPRLLILIRHAQSEGNRNRDIHQTVPDHRVKLTSEGWQQAYDAGRRLRKMLRADDTLHFFTSPYRRTRETTEGILATLTSDEPEPSPFKRNNIKVYEEPRLREQDFGNFQPCSAEMERMWQERADYGHFFYRIPNGESAADAYDRISGFNESLWRQFGEDDFASVCVLVTHGLMSRVFLMKWYHFSVEYFEDLRNVNHCEFLIMRKNEESGKYILDNKLRTWSELRRERAIKEKGEKGEKSEKNDDEGAAKEKGNGNSKDSSKLTRAQSYSTVSNGAPVENRRRWGGCPNGCNHDKNFKIRQTLADLVKSDNITSNGNASPTPATKSGTGSENGSGSSSNGTVTNSNGSSPRTHGVANPSFNGTAASHTAASGSPASSSTLLSRRPAAKRLQSHTEDNSSVPELTISGGGQIEIDVTKAREEIVSSPDGTPSFISVEDRLRNRSKSPLEHLHQQLHVGRDFGGTYSGHNSLVASDADSSEDEHHRRRMAKVLGLKENGDDVAAPVGGTNGTHDGGKKGLAPASQHLRQTLRDQSRMGRGAKANRLGDHPHSSDGEHEHDDDHAHCHHHHHHHDDHDHDHDHGHDGDSEGEGKYRDTGEGEGEDLTRTLTDEADEVLLRRAEEEDRSIQGSVY
ncbi:histidine phosphatase superfamily [Cercophora newfieldiana]|uniref:Histidine phosphatase superfamily n=1 Tax=Cercophora newfieldiana TaxID=92897 RepID=A0AA39YF87_9PEZI|nr:histidine phosphatase superfamily [Cercophora newfieldiana]